LPLSPCDFSGQRVEVRCPEAAKSVQPLVDVAHEALIRGWPKLREWVDQDREGLRIHRRLAEATTEWDRQHLNQDFLYRGIQLEAATDWRAQHADMLNQLERDFIDESLRLREAERAAQTAAETERFARIARDRVRTRQLIWLIINNENRILPSAFDGQEVRYAIFNLQMMLNVLFISCLFCFHNTPYQFLAGHDRLEEYPKHASD